MKKHILALCVLLAGSAFGTDYVTFTHAIDLRSCVAKLTWEEHKYHSIGHCEVHYGNPKGYQLIKGEVRSFNLGTTQFFFEGLADGFKLDVVDFGNGVPGISEVYAKLDATGGREIKSTVVKY